MAQLLTWNECVDLDYGRGRAAPAPAASIRRIDGYLGRPLDINEAWRSPAQADANYAAYQRYLNGGPWAPIALPASESIHCRGYAIDTDDHWATDLLRSHGWLQTVWREGRIVEPWHWEYSYSRDDHKNEPAGGISTPFPEQGEEDDMYSEEDRARDKETAERVRFIYGAIAGPANIGNSDISWYSIDQNENGENIVNRARYGLLDIELYTQQLAAQAARDSAAIIAQVNEELDEEEPPKV